VDRLVICLQGAFFVCVRELILMDLQAALSQKIRDDVIEDLVVTMSDMYAFLCEAEHVKRFESQAKVLTVMLKQTEECAYFIHGYAETKNFSMLLSQLNWISFLISADK
jgi:hypothetical protein